MGNVRVRIAPSPTGTPHVGTAYIALFNYCFAKSQGGTFVLRIEDTDQNRSRPEYEEAILNALRWTGLSWDEGPDVGGPHGPYRQSERTEIYRRYADQLVAAGHAYHCFCTPERLDALRESQKESGSHYGYDGHCSRLSAEEIAAEKEAGKSFTIRMHVPEEGVCKVHDRLRGDIEFDYRQIDHQILLKSDGFPTYHLANVVDDHEMGITHVIRGEEWLPSLPKHVLLYSYLGVDAPEVIHLPLLRNEDQSKLSKRKNPTSILYYRDLGILPESLLNFLGLMAYSMPNGEEVFSLQEMVELFDIGRVHLGGPIFDRQKLRHVNQKHIAALEEDALVERLKTWRFNDDFFRALVPMMRDRMFYLGDFMKYCDSLFYSEVSYETAALVPKKKDAEDTRDFLQKFVWELETVSPFDHDRIEEAFRVVGGMHGWTMRETTHAVRIAVCGKPLAPPLFHVLAILGSDLVRNRLMEAVTNLGPLGKKKLDKLRKQFDSQRASAAESET